MQADAILLVACRSLDCRYLVNRALLSLVKVTDAATIEWLLDDSVACRFLCMNHTASCRVIWYGSYCRPYDGSHLFVVVQLIARRISGKGGFPSHYSHTAKTRLSRKVKCFLENYCFQFIGLPVAFQFIVKLCNYSTGEKEDLRPKTQISKTQLKITLKYLETSISNNIFNYTQFRPGFSFSTQSPPKTPLKITWNRLETAFNDF